MLEQIADLVKEYGQDAVVNNSAIPNSQNNAVMAEATHTITGGLQNMLAGGGLQDLLSMFTGGGQSGQQEGIGGLMHNPAVSMMIGNFVNSLISKFNMNPAQAQSVSSSLIPNVLNGLINRTRSSDPSNESFNLNSLVGSLTGGTVATKDSGGGFDFQGLLNQFIGGGGNSGGGFNIQDVLNQVTQGAQNHQQNQAQAGGGITDMIKGLFN
ncbi:MAG: hypothetical protein QM764_18665 [Chitinophagaceae bacterium]